VCWEKLQAIIQKLLAIFFPFSTIDVRLTASKDGSCPNRLILTDFSKLKEA
jgi:hypothetical protein